MTELLPGSATTYTITVTNQGPDAVTGATLTDTAPAGLTFGNWTCVATRRIVVRERWRWQSLDRRQPAGWRHCDILRAGNLAADAPASVANTAVATVPSGSDRSGAGEQHGPPTVNEAVPPQSLAVEVRAGDPTVVGPAAFEVPYSIDVRNTGRNPLTNLRVVGFALLGICPGHSDDHDHRARRPAGPCRRVRICQASDPAPDRASPTAASPASGRSRTRRHSCSADPDRWASGRDAISMFRVRLTYRQRRGDSDGGAKQPRDGAHHHPEPAA